MTGVGAGALRRLSRLLMTGAVVCGLASWATAAGCGAEDPGPGSVASSADARRGPPSLFIDLPDGPQKVHAGSTLRLQILAHDQNGSPVLLQAKDLPMGASYDPDSGSLAYTPTYAQHGMVEIVFTDAASRRPGEGRLAIQVLALGWSALGRGLIAADPSGIRTVDAAAGQLVEFGAQGRVWTRLLALLGESEQHAWIPIATQGQGPDQPGTALVDSAPGQPAQAVVFEDGLEQAFLFDFATATWQAIGGATQPKPRRRFAAAFDPAGRRAFVFGGADPAGPRNDVWMIDLNTLSWAAIRPQGGAPTRRAGAAAVYDSAGDRLLIVGGDAGFAGQVERLRDVWQLDLGGPMPVWSEISPAGPPPPARADFAACHDSRNRRILMWGGVAQAKTAMDQPWELRFGLTGPSEMEWRPVQVQGSVPITASPRVDYDGQRVRVVLIAGPEQGGAADSALDGRFDVWELGL